MVARIGQAALPNYVISKCDGVSDLLEVAVLLREVGLLQVSIISPRPESPISVS